MKRKATSKPASNDAEGSNKDTEQSTTSPDPDYGTKEYWEARYKSHKLLDGDIKANADGDSANYDGTRIVDGVKLSDEVQARHAWYFSYEELRPLILGLVTETDDNEVDVDEYVSDDGSDAWEEVEEDGDEDGDNDEDFDDLSDPPASSDEVDPLEAHIKQSKLESHKSVLEIGCGDVPLGWELATELNSLQQSTGCNARNAVSSIECIDYSENVIGDLNKQLLDEMQKQRQDATTKYEELIPPIHPKFTAYDARSLPHESNSVSIILEKGTLDAMLSHPTEGISNSISIVKQMARVCEIGGAILIVSHLNARSRNGMEWVNNVLMVGLKEEWMERRKKQQERNSLNAGTGNEEVLWSVEVHGGADSNDNGKGGDEADDGLEPDYGPAVYILKKKGVAPSIFKQIMDKKKGESGDDNDVLPVKLEFLSYS